MNRQLAETLELTRQIPCRDFNDQKMQDQIEFCIGKLQLRAERLPDILRELEERPEFDLSDEYFEDAVRGGIEAEQLTKSLVELVLARMAIARRTSSETERVIP